MKLRWALMVGLLVLVAACGGDDSGGEASDADSGDGETAVSEGDEAEGGEAEDGETESGEADGGGGGSVVDPQPPGMAVAMVDGQEYTFDLPGGLACEVSEDEFSFSFRIGDNEVVVGGGATQQDGEWFGSISMQVFANNSVTDYSANIIDNPSAIAVDGQSASYSGPMLKTPPSEDGSVREPEDVGDGTISFTCA